MTRTRRTARLADQVRTGVFAELQRHIDARLAAGGDLVPLHIGDTCLLPPVAERAVPVGEVATYGAPIGLPEMRRALARSLARRGLAQCDVDPERELLVGVGATHALSCAVRAIVDPGDEVVLLAPYWPLAHGILASCGAVVVELPVTDRLYAAAAGERAFDLAGALAGAVTERTRAIYMITPNNPDGYVFTDAELEVIAGVAKEHDLWVIADEVYADYALERSHRSIAALTGMAERTLSAYSFSKSHALAGARVGTLVAPAEVIALARKFSIHSVFNVPVPMQRVAMDALADDAAWLEAARASYRTARDAMAEALRPLPVDFHLAQGGVYLFVDFTRALRGKPLRDLLARAIEHGVLFTPGEAFGLAYPTCARLCYTSAPLPRVLEGVARLVRALGTLS